LKTRISIDIGSRNVHIAEGGFHKGQLSLRQSRSFELPDGCVTEEAVKDEQLLADAIDSFIRQGKFHTKEAILTVNAKDAVIRELDFPKAKPKELDRMIRNEMVQTFHIMKSDAIQYKEIGKVRNEDGDTLYRYRVAALDQNIVEAYYSVMERAKLKAVAMDLNVNAVEKLYFWSDSMNERPYGDNAVMLLDFGQSTTTVYIFSKEQPMFYRHLNVGSGDIDGVLRSTAQQMTDLQPFFYRLDDEIRKVVTFYHERAQSAGIGCAYLFGMGSELSGLADYWSGSLNLPVEKLRSLGKSGKMIKPNPAHLNAVAALIRYDKERRQS